MIQVHRAALRLPQECVADLGQYFIASLRQFVSCGQHHWCVRSCSQQCKIAEPKGQPHCQNKHDSSSSAGSSRRRKTVREPLTTVLLVVLAAVKACKKFSELTLKIRASPVTPGIVPKYKLDLPHPL